MIADAYSEALPGPDKYRERTILHLQEFAGVFEEGRASRRKLHIPRRPLDEPAAQLLFEPLQPEADRGLCRPHGFSCSREASELGDVDESIDGSQVEGALYHFKDL